MRYEDSGEKLQDMPVVAPVRSFTPVAQAATKVTVPTNTPAPSSTGLRPTPDERARLG